MKRNLLVTLADKNYLDQAKQLFSCAYFNAGWQGDYMLLSHDIPQDDLEWFVNKGILIKECQPLFQGQVGDMAAVLTSKFYLFTPEFKRWDNIIYVDADIIIRASLDELSKVKTFAAVTDVGNLKLFDQFVKLKSAKQEEQALLRKLGKEYKLNSPVFNAGIFAFNSSLITPTTFSQLKNFIEKYNKTMIRGDQPAFNLFFYNQWKKLPQVYNMYITGSRNLWHLKLKKIKGIVIHFITPDKPWLTKNYFYQEWKNNLAKADNIDLNNIPSGNKWSQKQIDTYSNYLNKRYLVFYPYYYIDKKIGQLGLWIKKYSPSLYRLLGGMK